MKKPATPLPWAELRSSDARAGHMVIGGEVAEGATHAPAVVRLAGKGRPQDAAYIVAACNAYPRLVAALTECYRHGSGEHCNAARDLLRELGEL